MLSLPTSAGMSAAQQTGKRRPGSGSWVVSCSSLGVAIVGGPRWVLELGILRWNSNGVARQVRVSVLG